MPKLCITLLCPPAMEEKLLDLLLMSPDVEIFTSTATAAHGLSVGNLSQAEQVLGRALTTQIQAIFRAEDKTGLLETLHQKFAGSGLRYWLTTVLEAGEIV